MPAPATTPLLVDTLAVELTRKPVQHLRLRICSPLGQVRVTAPVRTPIANIQAFVRQHQAWIEHHQARLRLHPLPAPFRYETGETHYYQGHALRLVVHELPSRRAGGVVLAWEAGDLQMLVPPGSTVAQRAHMLARWRRRQLRALVPALLAKWELVVGVRAAAWGVKQMRTRWGTCSIRARRIWLSLELSQWPLACLEYVLVHELTHLHERLHSARFWQLVGQAMPDWQRSHHALKQGRLSTLPALL